MRAASLLPLVCAAAVVTACGSDVSSLPERDATASRPVAPGERDLTLQVPELPATEVASAVELARPQTAPPPTRTHRPRAKPKPAPRPAVEPDRSPAAPPIAPAAPVVTEVLADPAPVDDGVAGGRELAPGKTITIIPVSSGPTLEADEDDSWVPSERPRGIMVGGGDRCGRRGGARGIGIAGRIPVGIPTRRLR